MELFTITLLTIFILYAPQMRKAFFSHSNSEQENSSSLVINNQERDKFFDFLKGIAIILVVLGHVFTYKYYPYESFNNSFRDLFEGDLVISLVNNLFRFVIPLFFICSGILLNPDIWSKRKLINFYSRKFYRILLPYILLTSVLSIKSGGDISELFNNLVLGKASVPYYFIIFLFQFYLLYPLILRIKNNGKIPLLPISFFISLLCYLTNIGGTLFFGKFIFFFVYGIYRRDYFINYKLNFREKWYWFAIIFLYIGLIIFKPEFYNSIRLFYGLAVFNLLVYYKDKIIQFGRAFRLIANFGQNSLWIFLIHFPLGYVVYSYFDKFGISYYLNLFFIFLVLIPLNYFVAYIFRITYEFFITNKTTV